MKKCVFICLFFFVSAYAGTVQLKEKLANAEAGSYLVTEQNKTFTFLHVHTISDKSIILEEVSIPASLFMQNPMPWRCWFEKGAPGHTSWVMSQINLETGKFEEMFSFTHQGWVDLTDSNAFLPQLLNLSFNEVPEKERRKVGLAPAYHLPDKRPVWHPRIVFNGKIMSEIHSTAWKARWPSDGSELSRKWIEIYLPESKENVPSYFPYWVEVEGKIGSARMRVVDSGKGAVSPKGALPLRSPKVISQKFTPEGLELHLNTHFREFDVLAEEVDGFCKFFSLKAQTSHMDNEACLFIPLQELKKEMESGKSYRFLISVRGNPTACIETVMPFNPCL